MMSKSVVFTAFIVLGAAVADPLRVASNNDVTYSELPSYEMAAKTDVSTVIEIICALIGYKTSALSLAIAAIEWAVSNIFVIALGAATVLGFCKLTGKCSLNYEEYIPISQIQGYATPENIQTAERFFRSAVEKYAEKRKRSLD